MDEDRYNSIRHNVYQGLIQHIYFSGMRTIGDIKTLTGVDVVLNYAISINNETLDRLVCTLADLYDSDPILAEYGIIKVKYKRGEDNGAQEDGNKQD